MDAKGRTQSILLAALAAGLAVVVYREWPPAQGVSEVAGPRNTAQRPVTAGGPATTAPDVRLEALDAAKPGPGGSERNLFKFTPKRVFAPEPVRPPPAEAAVVAPSGPPSPPPIALKFIGVIEAAGARRIAILSDGRGAPIYGKEGEAVLGQYRILRIGAESIEMDYLDGRGRQTLRLSGS